MSTRNGNESFLDFFGTNKPETCVFNFKLKIFSINNILGNVACLNNLNMFILQMSTEEVYTQFMKYLYRK